MHKRDAISDFMKIDDIMIKNVAFVSPDDKISKTLSEMEARKIHQLPVIENGTLVGMILLKDIIMEDMDPSTINTRSIMVKNTPYLSRNYSEIEAVRILMGSGFRALPVLDGKKIVGMISETDILSLVKENISAGDIMENPVILSQDDGIGKAKQIFREKNISRLPVVDENGKLVGTLDTLDMIKTMKPKERQSLNKSGEGEKIQTSKIPVKNIMRNTDSLKMQSNISEIISLLQKQEEAIVVEEGKPVGIITPKDVVELLLSAVSDERIQISHMDKEDGILKNSIYQAMEKWLKKAGSDIDNIFIYVQKHAKNGKPKYSLRARIMANNRTISLKTFGWNALECAQNIIKKADRIIEKKEQKNRKRNMEKRITKKRWN